MKDFDLTNHNYVVKPNLLVVNPAKQTNFLNIKGGYG